MGRVKQSLSHTFLSTLPSHRDYIFFIWLTNFPQGQACAHSYKNRTLKNNFSTLYLFLESQSSSSGYGSYGSSGYGQAYGQYARSNDNAAWEGINILQWIQVLQDMYQNFDYNDLDCQKRMICEVMKEPEYYRSVARKFKNGFQYAKYLELMNLPDEMRELLDEYL